MGAFGVAILAKENYENTNNKTKLKLGIDTECINGTNTRCGRCSNNCLLTINKFPNGNKFISGNKCETPVSN